MNERIEQKLESLMKENKAKKEKLNFDTLQIPSPQGDFYFPYLHSHSQTTLPKPPPLSQFKRPTLQPIFKNSNHPKRIITLHPQSKPASPKKSESASHSQAIIKDSVDIFPTWLRERVDFQELRSKYDVPEVFDVFKICIKPAANRNEIEQRAIVNWARGCPFFSTMTEDQLAILAERLKPKQFSKGVTLIRKGEAGDCMYVIVEGVVGVYMAGDRPIDEIIAKNVVGEAALRTNATRTATIIAHTPLKVLKLLKEDYEKVMFKVKLQEVYQVLKSLRLFSDWQANKLRRLSTMIMVKQYEPGQVVYQLNEDPVNIYIVKSGTVHLLMEVKLEKMNRWPQSKTQWEMVVTEKKFKRVVRVCKDRDVFGEMEIIQGLQRTTRAVSADISVLYLLRVEDFKEAFSEKDKRKLIDYNESHPSHSRVQSAIKIEKEKITAYSEAILNAINANSIPSGRGLFDGPENKKKLKLARRVMSRERRLMADQLVSQTKTSQLMNSSQVSFWRTSNSFNE